MLYPQSPICNDCFNLLEVINPNERCLYCFSELDEPPIKICSDCYSRFPAYDRIASVFDYEGPFASLIKHFKYHDKPWLSKSIYTFINYQLVNLDWPKPDLIIPMPICWSHWIVRGYNQSLLLAQDLGQLRQIPVLDVIKRKSTEFSQAGKNKWQRRQLPVDSFSISSKYERAIKDKYILLIDDVFTTGRTVECCSEVLMQYAPKKIYVLTACKAV